MSGLIRPFRRATSEDAADMAALVNMAGHGLPLYLWSKSARPGQTPREVGLERARRGAGGFAYRNTVVREEGGKTAACLIGYPLADSLESPREETPAVLVPLLELENTVPKSWYINVLATYPEHRGKGLGSELLGIAKSLARAAQCEGISLIVSDSNTAARRLYERHGYTQCATRPIAKENWEHPGQNWILMVKD